MLNTTPHPPVEVLARHDALGAQDPQHARAAHADAPSNRLGRETERVEPDDLAIPGEPIGAGLLTASTLKDFVLDYLAAALVLLGNKLRRLGLRRFR